MMMWHDCDASSPCDTGGGCAQEHNVGIKCATITPDEQRMDGENELVDVIISQARNGGFVKFSAALSAVGRKLP